MMEVILYDNDRDSRGIPYGMDPHKFYEYSYQKRVSQARYLEAFAYSVIPYHYIKSFAYALDPFYKFKVSKTRVAQATRKRIRNSRSIFDQSSKMTQVELRYVLASPPNWEGYPGIYGPPSVIQNETTTQNWAHPVQEQIDQYSLDSTDRTRPFDVDQGEFEKFKYNLRSPSLKVSIVNYSLQTYYWDGQPFSPVRRDDIHRKDYTVGRPGWMSKSTLESARDWHKSTCRDLINKHSYGLLTKALPSSRTMSLGRSIAELRDLPRSIAQLRETTRHLSELISSLNIDKTTLQHIFQLKGNINDIPKEYLSFHFGWKQIYKDALDLLNAPTKISRRINRLILRNGKATTFRAGMKIPVPLESPPRFSFSGIDTFWMSDIKDTHVGSAEAELRLVVNTTFDFPTGDIPAFKEQEFLRMLGVVPTYTDLYKLVPWTWLIDWFTGIGQYLDCIETINSDRSIINYGFVTCILKSQSRSTHQGRIWNSQNHHYMDGKTVDSSHYQSFLHTSYADFEYAERIDLSRVDGVRSLSDLTSLNDFQSSILGSLLMQRNKI